MCFQVSENLNFYNFLLTEVDKPEARQSDQKHVLNVEQTAR